MKKETANSKVPSAAEAWRWAGYVLLHPEQRDWTAEEAFAAYRKEFPEPLS